MSPHRVPWSSRFLLLLLAQMAEARGIKPSPEEGVWVRPVNHACLCWTQ